MIMAAPVAVEHELFSRIRQMAPMDAVTSRPFISSRPSNPLSAFLLHFRFGFG